MKRGVWLRLGALLVLFLLGASYIAFDVVGAHLGSSPYTVTVQLPEAGGIYPAASVTYRGVSVGKVSALHLKPDVVDVELAISPGTRIPANVTASVHELTAAGEQYLDLVPTSSGGPYLHSGSVLREGPGAVPVSVGDLLANTGALLNSINTKDLSTVNQTLAAGFAGAGDSLRQIIVGGQVVAMALAEAEPATVDVIDAGNNVLQTLDDTNQAFGQFSASLNQLTTQLVHSNGDITGLLANGATASSQTSLLLQQYSQNFEGLIANSATVTNVGAQQPAAMQALFAALPVFGGRIASVARNGKIQVELYVNSSSPVCTYSGAPTAGPTAATNSVYLNGSCTTQAPNLLQRGASTAPTVPTSGG